MIKSIQFTKLNTQKKRNKQNAPRMRSYNGISFIEQSWVFSEQLLKPRKVAGVSVAVDGGGLGGSRPLIWVPLHVGVFGLKTKKGKMVENEWRERRRGAEILEGERTRRFV